MLSNYASSGSSALAASTKNAYLYDFMARSVNGAQCTTTKSSATTVSANGTSLGTVAKGTTLQQEFFNYVVASGTGVGTFIQNIIGGGKYTGAYSNSYDLSSYNTIGAIYFSGNDSDADYNTASANGGDKDTDWFVQGMYFYGSGAGYSQFATIYKLTQNNSTALNWYNKWIARFHGKGGQAEKWGYLSNQTAKNTSYLLRFNWSAYLNGTASSTGKLTDNDDAKFVGYSNSSTLFTGTQIGKGSPKTPHSIDGVNVQTSGTWTWSTPLNTTYTGFDKVTVGFSMTSGATLPSNCITVRILAGSNPITSTTTNGSSPATLTIPTAYRSGYNLYLEVYISSDSIYNIGSTLFWAKVTDFSFSLSSVNLYWSSSAQTCLTGHNWGDAVYTYSSDKKTCTVKHTCSTCGVDENETITAVQTASTTTTYTYKYTPTSISSVSAWSKTYSRDYGSGTVSFTSSSGSSNVAGTWSKTNSNYTVGYSHNLINGTWYSVTTSTVQATGTAVINKGAIKTNVQTVKAVSNYSDDYMTVIVYSSSGTILKQNSGYQTVTVDLSTIDNADKLNCYVQIIHSRINSNSNYQSGDWNSFPSAPNISVTSILSYVAITY